MAPCRIRTFAWPLPRVFDAAVAAATGLGFWIIQADRACGHLYLSQPRRLGRRDWPFDMSVTDSGMGATIVHIAWGTRRPLSWPLASPRRRAVRLCRQMREDLEAVGPF